MGLLNFGKNKKNEDSIPEIWSMQEVFSHNRKYITDLTKDAEAINGQFVKKGRRDFMRIGTVSCPSGRIAVGDPLAYMPTGKFAPELVINTAPGSYPVDIAIIRSESFGLRICTARLKITDNTAVRYEPAESTEETAINKGPDGAWSGFPVETGTAAFMDAEVLGEYIGFIDKWYAEHPDKNHYDDYFMNIYAESYAHFPDFQREGGDFIEWSVPGTEHGTVFFSTGFGDGLYQSFWGYDGNGDLCELIMPFVDPDDIEEAERRYEEMEKHLPQPSGCIVTRKLLEGPLRAGYLYREEPSEGVPDSGWRMFAGDEDEAYLDDAKNMTYVPLSYICKNNTKIFPLINAPAGSAYFLDEDGEYKYEER